MVTGSGESLPCKKLYQKVLFSGIPVADPPEREELASSAVPRLPSSLQWRYRLAVRNTAHQRHTLHSFAAPHPEAWLFFNSALFPACRVTIMNWEFIGTGEDVAYCNGATAEWLILRLTRTVTRRDRCHLPSASQHCFCCAYWNVRLKYRHTKVQFQIRTNWFLDIVNRPDFRFPNDGQSSETNYFSMLHTVVRTF
jgi:hypothetical protein